MNSGHSIYVYFCLDGDFGSADLVAETGLIPSSVLEKGCVLPNGRVRDETLCRFIITEGSPLEAMEHVEKWAEAMQPFLPKVKAYVEAHEIRWRSLTAVVKLMEGCNDSAPAVCLCPKVTALLGELGAWFDCDLYYDM